MLDIQQILINGKGHNKSTCQNEIDKAFSSELNQMIRNNGGFKMFKMIEICKYACNDSREAKRKQDEMIK
jgi:hypothetical protein